ncbi:MAG: GDSL-type esterase/lipase family protein [Sediminibacterium sp.]
MKKSLLVFSLCLMFHWVFAQNLPHPFQKDIDAFVLQDQRDAPPVNPILLIGSSSFTFWKDVQQVFPAFPILNRGFGGSSLTDLIHFAPQVIFAYTPRQIIIYCGENDLAATPPVGPKVVLQRFRKLFKMIRSQWPEMPLVYISIKPSPSRWQLEPQFVEANRRISAFLRNKKNACFLDVHTAMLDSKGNTRPELYINDRLHMNSGGYAIWQNLLRPLLLSGEGIRSLN